jgi:hypothetical protein
MGYFFEHLKHCLIVAELTPLLNWASILSCGDSIPSKSALKPAFTQFFPKDGDVFAISSRAWATNLFFILFAIILSHNSSALFISVNRLSSLKRYDFSGNAFKLFDYRINASCRISPFLGQEGLS